MQAPKPDPSPLTPAHRGSFRRPGHVVPVRDGLEVVLNDLQRGRSYRLNPLGSLTWHLLETGLSFAAIVERLREECDLPPEEVLTTTAALIDRLVDRGLLAPEP